MKKKLIRDFSNLSEGDLKELAHSLRSNNYSLSVNKPNFWNAPKGVFKSLTQKTTYERILDDPEARFLYIVLKYQSSYSNRIIEIPVSIFGKSPKNGVNFPILVGSFCVSHIMIGKDQLKQLLHTENEDIQPCFDKLLEIREGLIDNIFKLYKKNDTSQISAMGWPLRNTRSLTRLVAERNGFIRLEDKASNTEFYFPTDVDQDLYNYVLKCNVRWNSFPVPKKDNPTPDILDRIAPFLRKRKSKNLKTYYLHLTSPKRDLVLQS